MLAALLVGLFSLPALAQFTKDASANKKIDEAINNHYLMMQLDKAENLLTGTVDACADKCSPATKAKAWMYVGIVRGSGNNDQAGAAEAFAMAKGIDPNVTLDEALATPETKTTFDSTAGGQVAAPVATAPVAAAPVAAAAGAGSPATLPPPEVPGDMICGPQGVAVQTGMPIPFSCTSDAEVASGFVKFQEPGSSDWKKVALMNIDGFWQAELPCKYTAKAGQFKFYVGVKDANGEYVDQFGSKKKPASLELSETGEAPSFPGQAPLARCAVDGGAADCPPDFPGCESSTDTKTCGDLDWGASCGNSTECKCGLLCEEGQCATSPTCNIDADCETGSCVDGFCSALSTGGSSASAGPLKKHWISFSAGIDAGTIGGEALCSQGRQEGYGTFCYDESLSPAVPVVSPTGYDVDGSGFAPGQMRLKVGYDRAVTSHIQVGLRLGVSLLNVNPRSFIPVHAALRGTYAFTSLARMGIRPSLYLAAGYAQSNLKLKIGDVGLYKISGDIFAAPGGTLAYQFSPEMAVAADVQFMILFPDFGTVIHPALSFTYAL